MEALCVIRPWIVDHEASCPASRLTTHDSGSVWLATPSPYGSFIRSSTPVYPGALTRNARPPADLGASRGAQEYKMRKARQQRAERRPRQMPTGQLRECQKE